MNTTDPVVAAAAPLDDKTDKIGHLLILAGSLLHGIGGKLLRARNEKLGAELGETRERMATAVEEAYHLGRHHERESIPAPSADVDEHQSAEQNSDLVDDAAVLADSAPSTAAAAK